MKHCVVIFLLGLTVVFGATEVMAEDAIVASRIRTSPTIDGRLNDAAWKNSVFIGGFVQQEPNWGDEALSPTQIAVGYDDEAIYIAAKLWAPKGRIHANMTRRDQIGTTDWFAVSLDGFGTGASAYTFAVTAAGVRADWYHADDSDQDRDYSYNPVWEAHTQVQSDRWTLEIRIPLSQVRFDGDTEWKMNFVRSVPATQERLAWTLVPKEETLWQSQFKVVEGLKLERRFHFEFLPFVTVGQTISDDNAMQKIGLDPELRGGADLKVGLGPDFTLDATVLPDFGQLEADPTVVNLSEFEVFFEERRPFFIEGAELLAGSGKTYYYSRRIGAAPPVCDDGEYQDCPTASTILGAAKITGRIASRTVMGAQVAVTDQASAVDVASAQQTKVAPLTVYGVGRLQREVGQYGSLFGASFTSVSRAQTMDDASASRLADEAFGGGLDFRHRFASGSYQLSGDLGFTHLNGSEDAIDRIVRSPVHLFQRPDQDHVSIEAGQTTLTGYAGSLAFGKRRGTWQYEVGSEVESPAFNPNDLGQLQSADNIVVYGGLIHNLVAEGNFIRQARTVIAPAIAYNFGGVRDPGGQNLSSTLTLSNFWQVRMAGSAFTPGRRDTSTRGGLLMGVGWGGELSASLENAPDSRNGWSVSVTGAQQEVGDSGVRVGASGRMQLGNRLSLVLSADYWRAVDNRQFVDSLSPTETLFGTIDRVEVGTRASLQLAITPNLSLDATTQPFAARGTFSKFGVLRESGSEILDPIVYDEDVDFGLLALRSTLVLRWEYLPGSTALLVWSQNHDASTGGSQGLRSLLGDRPDLFGSNLLLLKVNYWFSR